MPSFLTVVRVLGEEEAARGSEQPTDSRRRLRPTDLLLLGVPALWAPARLVSGNFVGIPHLERLLLGFLVLWAVGAGVAFCLVYLGAPRRPSVHTTFVLMTTLVSFGPVMRSLGSWLGGGLIVLLVVVVGGLSIRLQESVIPDAVAVAVSVALLAGPAIATVRTATSYGQDTSQSVPAFEVVMEERPDIWMVVLDGYPGRIGLAEDHGIRAQDQLLTELEARGFETPSSAWSAYPNTKFSMPSMLEMGYPTADWVDNGATTQAMYDIISGENTLVEILEDNGYETHMVESGWSGSSCGSAYDRCVPAPFYDAGMNFIAFNSVLGDQPIVRPGYAFALGAQSTMTWMRENVDELSSDDVPSFVFAHLVVPHPPFFLDSECNRVVERDRDGFFFPYPDVPTEDRDRYFREQLQCVDSFVAEFSRMAGADDVLVFLADHGTGRKAQMGTPPEDWGLEAIRERMNVFVAVRGLGECSVGDPVVLPNLMRGVLGCLSLERIAEVDARMFIGPDVEVTGDLLPGLMGGR